MQTTLIYNIGFVYFAAEEHKFGITVEEAGGVRGTKVKLYMDHPVSKIELPQIELAGMRRDVTSVLQLE